MKANQILLSATFTCAIGALAVTFAEDTNAARQMTPKAVQMRAEGELPSLGGATHARDRHLVMG